MKSALFQLASQTWAFPSASPSLASLLAFAQAAPSALPGCFPLNL